MLDSYQNKSELPERPSNSKRTGPSLRQRALRLLARREHSRHELIQKLTPHETVPGELAQVLDEFAAKGLIDEDRVVDMLLHRHAPRSGHRRLRQTLSQKGLTEDRIEAALKQVLPTLSLGTSDDLGWPRQAIEPAAFALLAAGHLWGVPGNLPETTGAAGPRILGQLTMPPPSLSAT